MKHIEMTVTTNERAQDVFRLKTEPEHIDVVLTEDNGTKIGRASCRERV